MEFSFREHDSLRSLDFKCDGKLHCTASRAKVLLFSRGMVRTQQTVSPTRTGHRHYINYCLGLWFRRELFSGLYLFLQARRARFRHGRNCLEIHLHRLPDSRNNVGPVHLERDGAASRGDAAARARIGAARRLALAAARRRAGSLPQRLSLGPPSPTVSRDCTPTSRAAPSLR